MSMSLIFSKESFQLPICLRMLYPYQNWLYTIFFEVLLEITIPIAIFMYAMGSKTHYNDRILALALASHQYLSTI